VRTKNLTTSAVLSALLLAAGISVTSQETPPAAPPQGGAHASPAAQAPQEPPKVAIPEFQFDAGTVIKGEVIKHDFVVENKGKGPLAILSVKPGCGCTVPDFDKTVPPGAKGRITLSVATQAFKGPISKSTTVTTDDPVTKSFQLVVKAEIKEIIAVLPSENQQFGLVGQGQKLSRDYTLKSTDGKPFQITKIDSNDLSLKHEMKMAPDGKSGVFTVTVPPDHALGAVNARFTLKTDHPQVPVIQLNAYATVREPLAVDPSSVSFGEISGTDLRSRPDDLGWTRMITVSDDRGGLEIKEVRSSNPILTTTLVPAEPGKRTFVKVRLMPEAKAGDFKGTITIVTPKKSFEVPVNGKVTPKTSP
jgi:hypothetical protein